MIEQPDNSSNSRVLKVFLGGLPSHWESDQVTAFMEGFGKVLGVQIKRDASGYSKGFGFVYLEEHLDLKQLYGKHLYGENVIEIKELKQKHIYLSFEPGVPKLSESFLAQALFQQGHQVESIEVGGKATQGAPNIAKITFVHDSSAKYLLQRKFVDIERVSYNVYSSIDYQKPRINSPSAKNGIGRARGQIVGEYGPNKRYKNNHYNYHEFNQEEVATVDESVKVDSSKPKRPLVKPHEDSLKPQTQLPDSIVDKESNKQTIVTVVLNSTQSSDDQLSTGKAKANEPNRSARKLSYKGKEIEFHPSHVLEETPQLLVVESSPRNLDFPSDFSSSSRDHYSSISKLSSSSMDWKLENLVMWPQAAGYNPQMLYSMYSQIPPSAAFYPSLKKSAEWPAQKEHTFEHPKKKDVRIEFFTFPGFV